MKKSRFTSSVIATTHKWNSVFLCVSNRTAVMEGGSGCAAVTPGSEVISRMGKVLAASISPKFALCIDPLTVQQQLINM